MRVKYSSADVVFLGEKEDKTSKKMYRIYSSSFYKHPTTHDRMKKKRKKTFLAWGERGAVVAQWLGRWTQDSRVVGSIPTPGMVRF